MSLCKQIIKTQLVLFLNEEQNIKNSLVDTIIFYSILYYLICIV